MAANTRIVRGVGVLAAVTPPVSAVGAPPAVGAMALIDGSGNVIRAADNGDGTASLHGNYDATLITAAAVTVTQTGTDQINANGRGLKVVLDMTTVGTGSVTLTIQGRDVTSGKYFTLLAGAAVVTNSTNVYTVYPGAPVTANVSANDLLPRTWRVVATANNANATTYTVGASVIV